MKTQNNINVTAGGFFQAAAGAKLQAGRVSGTKSAAGKSKSGSVKKRINFNATGTMMQIARARTKFQAAAIERYLRALLREAKQCDSDPGTIKAIKKTVSKAGGKAKAMGREERMENMRKAAAAGDNLQEAARIAEELNRKRRARIRREKADIVQAKLEDTLRGSRAGGKDIPAQTAERRLRELLREEERECKTQDSAVGESNAGESAEGEIPLPEAGMDGAGEASAVVDVLL